MRTANVGVTSYILAVIASICIPLALMLTTGIGMKLFPEPDHQDLLQAVHTILYTHITAR